jgi:hypothetical protein
MLRAVVRPFRRARRRFRTSQGSLILWFRLLGFCLRPGYGVTGDVARVDKIWQMVNEEFPYANPNSGLTGG